MAAKILVCGMGELEYTALCKMCEQEGFVKPVLLLDGHKDMLIKELLIECPEVENRKVMKERMVLFNDLPQGEIVRFIECYKKNGFPRPYFCMVTETNLEWSVEELIKHLVQERLEIEGKKRL